MEPEPGQQYQPFAPTFGSSTSVREEPNHQREAFFARPEFVEHSPVLINGMSHTVNSPSIKDIYTAQYSNVNVIEMSCRGVAVMRRLTDNYLNATQILKVAGIEKGKRTKILEKEILTGVHEKVQGGYGKYQGAWIPFDIAVDFCRRYEVEEILRPILLNNSVSAQTIRETPTKEQHQASQRKFLKTEGGNRGSLLSGSQLGQYSARRSAYDPSQGRLQTPQINGKRSVRGSSPRLQTSSFHEGLQTSSQPTVISQATPTERQHEIAPIQGQAYEETTNGISNKSWQVLQRQASMKQEQHLRSNQLPDGATEALPPLDESTARNFMRSRDILTSVFLADSDSMPPIFVDPVLDGQHDVDMDVPIDELGHSALHWASALARISLVEALISKGANPRRVNYNGETSLTRAVLVTNNLDNGGTFGELLELLHPAIPLRDENGRSVLHHICVTAGIKGRSAASKYYLETLLEFIVRHGDSKGRSESVSSNKPDYISLEQFTKNIVNAKDKNGDTALNIAARIGNRALVQQLLDINADPYIANRAGLRPIDSGVVDTRDLPPPATFNANGTISSPKSPVGHDSLMKLQATEKSSDILASMQGIISALNDDFNEEMAQKQTSIDATHAQLRDANKILADLRRNLQNSKEKAAELRIINQRCLNIRKAINKEKSDFMDYAPILNDLNSSMHEDVSIQKWGDASSDQVYSVDPDVPFLVDINDPSTYEEIPISILQARVRGYRQNLDMLHGMKCLLEERSANLEAKCRKVISLCTGTEESMIDELLQGLLQAIESDGDPSDFDVERVSGFLKIMDK